MSTNILNNGVNTEQNIIALNDDEENICRICLEETSDLENDDLRCRCKCKSSKYHDSCIIKWINTKKSKKCEICNTNYLGIKHGTVKVKLTDVAKQFITLIIASTTFIGVLWLIYFIIEEPPSCKNKDLPQYSIEHRNQLAKRCKYYNEEKSIYLITVIIINFVYISTILVAIIFQERFGLIQRIYNSNFVIDKNYKFTEVNIPVIFESVENEIINPQEININISNLIETEDSTDSVISI